MKRGGRHPHRCPADALRRVRAARAAPRVDPGSGKGEAGGRAGGRDAPSQKAARVVQGWISGGAGRGMACACGSAASAPDSGRPQMPLQAITACHGAGEGGVRAKKKAGVFPRRPDGLGLSGRDGRCVPSEGDQNGRRVRTGTGTGRRRMVRRSCRRRPIRIAVPSAARPAPMAVANAKELTPALSSSSVARRGAIHGQDEGHRADGNHQRDRDGRLGHGISRLVIAHDPSKRVRIGGGGAHLKHSVFTKLGHDVLATGSAVPCNTRRRRSQVSQRRRAAIRFPRSCGKMPPELVVNVAASRPGMEKTWRNEGLDHTRASRHAHGSTACGRHVMGTWPGACSTRASQASTAGKCDRSKSPSGATCVCG